MAFVETAPADVQACVDLETPLKDLEHGLAELGRALQARDPRDIETRASELHRCFASAIDRFDRAARTGGVPEPLRRRLALLGGHVAAQREALARATAALDRAIDVLIPERDAPLYGASGNADRLGGSASLHA